jgi:hypothetical protein
MNEPNKDEILRIDPQTADKAQSLAKNAGESRILAQTGDVSAAVRKPYRKSSTYGFISFAGTLAVVSLILFSFRFRPAARQERPTAHQPPSNGSFVDSDNAIKRQDVVTPFPVIRAHIIHTKRELPKRAADPGPPRGKHH